MGRENKDIFRTCIIKTQEAYVPFSSSYEVFRNVLQNRETCPEVLEISQERVGQKDWGIQRYIWKERSFINRIRSICPYENKKGWREKTGNSFKAIRGNDDSTLFGLAMKTFMRSITYTLYWFSTFRISL